MKVLLALLALLSPITSTQREEWNLVSANRSYEWYVQTAKATLERSGNHLSGKARSNDGIEFLIDLTIHGKKASGTLEVVQSDSGPISYSGTYQRSASSGPNNCWETIQLFDGSNFVGLARNSSCEP